jgi:hypothetical protein
MAASGTNITVSILSGQRVGLISGKTKSMKTLDGIERITKN